ncbi:MAG: hypothetical protein A3B86_04335 [Candidatus Yanofskybacteria bacterium RIFCSPHIGHO2_02_FULL_38_22b]|uniref:Uncharacterized protein n=1 Tax=Candidatus Yanofskybacteria bacterium RIFCSPHIGHO2_02_FULL_38_22b TaxID=1802673 RepID=A0A1F8F254_9BACT|nr:MAG: hypothetical protein A2816_02105 [Candidatus Yanofskybacteria bacterium RIFCSPHIGHO2_01_FULL_39_44]OGN06316.1 MAG: hypothetical protein A3B86_04335 [Candidatus Yanofskybacteria bacterium RIFCSPHIGHO2_02_FULL_38_22b]OGN19735.1 MAG: hypothetical protein A2910_04070 [Candidatus Yanofskybacteria bacterium RIFCSPLOWO2_01_FULL_39_28]
MALPSWVDPNNKGITVQVLARHPHIPTMFRWAHNLEEQESPNLEYYDNESKKAGWGNGGGGLEADDRERLVELYGPDHPILADRSLSETQKLIIAGGIREFVCETGYRDIEIITNYPGVFLFDYKYKDRVNKRGIICPGGHRKITLWGQMTSFISYPDLHIEKHEVDKSDWFDLAVSLPKQFFNRFTHPDRPYWSHVRSTLASTLRLYRHLRSMDPYLPDIRDKIHSSWWSIFSVGNGDPRFPVGGYRPSPTEWYDVFDISVSQKMEYVDRDFWIKFLGRKLDDALRREEVELGTPETVESEEVLLVTEEIEDSEDSDGIPSVEELRNQEDREYAAWLEEFLDLSEDQRVVDYKPVH